MTNLFMGDDAYHGGAFMLSANFGFYTFFRPQQGPRFRRRICSGSITALKDGYDFYLKMGSLSNAKALYFKDPNWLWTIRSLMIPMTIIGRRAIWLRT